VSRGQGRRGSTFDAGVLGLDDAAFREQYKARTGRDVESALSSQEERFFVCRHTGKELGGVSGSPVRQFKPTLK
jgi:hypothetical protein